MPTPNFINKQVGAGGGIAPSGPNPMFNDPTYATDFSNLQDAKKAYSDAQNQYNTYKSLPQGAQSPSTLANMEWQLNDPNSQLNSDVINAQNQMKSEANKTNAISPLNDLAKQQQDQADQFSMNFPSIIDQQMIPVENQARQSIAQNIAGNNRNYNSRGLLYSGMAAGANANAAAGLPQTLASTRANANTNAQNELNTLYQNAANTGLRASTLGQNYANTDNSLINSLIDVGMGQQAQAANAIGNLVGVGGQAAGTAIGNASAPTIQSQIESAPLSTVSNDNMYFNPTGAQGIPMGLNPALSGYGGGLLNRYPAMIS